MEWKATWIDQAGREREFIFTGPGSRAVSRIDFQIECIAAGEPVPVHFELEEVAPTPQLSRGSVIPHRPHLDQLPHNRNNRPGEYRA